MHYLYDVNEFFRWASAQGTPCSRVVGDREYTVYESGARSVRDLRNPHLEPEVDPAPWNPPLSAVLLPTDPEKLKRFHQDRRSVELARLDRQRDFARRAAEVYPSEAERWGKRAAELNAQIDRLAAEAEQDRTGEVQSGKGEG